MKRKNWTSLLVVFAMIMSMATIILLPTGAEEIDYDALPSASSAVRGDKIDAYKIDSVAELLNTGKNLRLRGYGATGTSGGKESGLSGDARYTIWNFEPTDTIYLTADLDIADWDYTSVATYDEATGLYTPNYYANMDSAGNDRGCVTFVDNDGSVTASSLQELFSVMYAGWSWGYSALRGYNVFCFTFDGLGHTISNFYDTHSFFRGMYVGVLKNLTFDNAYVDAQPVKEYGYYHASIIALGINDPAVIGWSGAYASTMDNVHVINSTLKTPAGAKDVGIMYTGSNKGAGTLNIKNSSIINTTIDCGQAYANNACFGLVCGYNNAPVDVQNSLFLNNTIKHANDIRYSNGLVLGNSDRNGNVDYSFENVAVAGNKIIAPNADTLAYAVHASGSSAKDTTAKDLYLVGNVYALAEDGAEAPIASAFGYTGTSAKEPSFVGVNTDSTVVNLFDASATPEFTVPNAPENVDAGMTPENVATRMNNTLAEGMMIWALRKDGSPVTAESAESLPHTLTFLLEEGQLELLTDYEKTVIADESQLTYLMMNEWDPTEGRNIPVGTDWSVQEFATDNIFTLVSHDVTYTANEDGTHTATCNTCYDELHNGTHSCEATAPHTAFVEGSYYAPSVDTYTCLICGNVLTEVNDGASASLLAPYAVTFEKDLYSNIDDTVKVTFTAPADANLVGFTAIVNFDPSVMTYKDCAPADPAYACIVNTADAATGKLVVSIPSLDGTVMTQAEAVLNFDFDPIVEEGVSIESISVSTELISALVYTDEEGTVEMINNVVKKDSEAFAAVTYVETNVLPGDVNNDGVVELLDAVILIEKISGQLHVDQDGDAFFIMASDVNKDGVTNRLDAETIMEYVGNSYTELVSCEDIPEIIYD